MADPMKNYLFLGFLLIGLSVSWSIAQESEVVLPPTTGPQESLSKPVADSAKAYYDKGVKSLARGDRDTALQTCKELYKLNEELAEKFCDQIPIYIPKDLKDCVSELKKILPDSVLEQIRADEYPGSSYLFEFRIGLVNSWGLITGGRLAKYFNERGIFNPGAIPHIFFEALEKDLRGEESDFEKEHPVDPQQWRKHRMRMLKWEKEYVKNDPEHAIHRANLARTYSSLEKWKKAFREAEKCLDLDPHEERCYESLADIHVGQENDDMAVEVLREGFENIPETRARSSLKVVLGDLYSKNGEWEKALKQYEQADHMWPSDYKTGLALFELGRYEEALQSFDVAIEMHSSYAKAHFYRGLCYARMGDEDAAVKVCTWLSMIDDDMAGELRRMIKDLSQNRRKE